MGYENLLFECDNEGINVKEKPLQANNGLCKGNKIAIKNTLSTKEKYCTLSEELGHYKLTVGDITDLKDINNIKQELKARRWGHKHIVSLDSIIEAFDNNCLNKYEIAEYLGVTDKYFEECMLDYKKLYGTNPCKIGKYHIIFEPSLGIYQKF